MTAVFPKHYCRVQQKSSHRILVVGLFVLLNPTLTNKGNRECVLTTTLDAAHLHSRLKVFVAAIYRCCGVLRVTTGRVTGSTSMMSGLEQMKSYSQLLVGSDIHMLDDPHPRM